MPINFLTVHSEPVGNRTRIIASLERKGLRVRTGVEGSLPTDGAADETPEREGLILDLSDSEVKKLIKTGEARGHITYDELSAVLPAEEFTVDQITEVMAMFSGMGIEVVE